MAMMNDSKGGSNLAQSFLGNTATQAQPLPQITAPQGNFAAPQLPAPAAAPAPMPQAQPTERWTYLGKEIPADRARQLTYGFGSNAIRQRGQMPIREMIQAAPTLAPQPAYQPSQAALMARAINERAAARGK